MTHYGRAYTMIPAVYHVLATDGELYEVRAFTQRQALGRWQTLWGMDRSRPAGFRAVSCTLVQPAQRQRAWEDDGQGARNEWTSLDGGAEPDGASGGW